MNVAIVGVGGQGRTNARALLHEKGCQVIAIADPAEDWDLSAFYYGGRGDAGRSRPRSRAPTPRVRPTIDAGSTRTSG